MDADSQNDHENGIFLQIQRKVENNVLMKKKVRKKIKKQLERAIRSVLIKIFSSSSMKVKRYDGTSHFGCDLYGRDVEDGLLKYIRVLMSRNVNVHTVIVLGSRAKGRWTPESDVDVTIIASNLPPEGKNIISKRFFDMVKRVILSDRPLYLGVEPSGCCSKDEFLRRLKNFDTQVLDAIYYGKVIYDDGFWKTVKDEYDRIKMVYELDDSLMKKLLFPL